MTETLNFELEKLAEIRRTRLLQEKRQNVCLRVSGKALQTAKAFGKGHCGLMSEILEKVLADPELLKKVLEK